MTLKVCLQHPVLQYYQVFSNDDPGLTLTYFTSRSNLVPYAFVWEKVKTMDFLETIAVYDIKVGRCSQLNEYMKLYEYLRSRSLIDLGPNLSDSIVLSLFSSITTMPIEAKFHMEPPLDGDWKLVKMVQVTWQRWPPCPYVVKTIKDIFLWKWKADDLETWYTALSTRVLPSMFIWCPWVDRNLFYGNNGNYCSLWYKSR